MGLIPFALVLLISIGASLFASKEKDFFLANRSIRWPMLVGTFVGLQVGGGFILGNTDAAWKLGWFGSMYGVGLALGMLGLGLGIAAKLRTLQIGTLSELLEKRYGSKSLKTVAGLLSIFSLGGILMCQAIGLRKFLLSMGLENEWIYLFSWAAVVFYTTCGGLLAVIWTDTIQAIVMVGMLICVFVCAIMPQWGQITAQAASMGSLFDGAVLSSLIIPFCFAFVEQDLAQRCFAAKTPKDATKACIVTAILLLLLNIIPTACGILGRAIGVSPENGSVFILVIKQMASPAIALLAASAVLLALVSTASALLMAVSSNVAQDIGFKRGRAVTVSIGMIALVGPYIGSEIIPWMVASYEILVGALFIPLLAAMFTKRVCLPKESAWGSAILGSAGTVLVQQLPQDLYAVAIPFLLSTIGFAIGLMVGKNPKEYQTT